MTVKDLITKLQKFPEDTQVVVFAYDEGYKEAVLEVLDMTRGTFVALEPGLETLDMGNYK